MPPSGTSAAAPVVRSVKTALGSVFAEPSRPITQPGGILRPSLA